MPSTPVPRWTNAAEPIRDGIFAEGPQHAEFYELPAWGKGDDRKRVAFLRELVDDYASDPRFRWFAAGLLQTAGVPPRDYPRQAAYLLSWVQETIYYTHEVREQIQSPWRTLQVRTGDCDDAAILLATLAQAIGLPWVFVLAGKDRRGRQVRWAEGQAWTPGTYYHIYVALGWPPGRPQQWASAEPTLQGAPLGFDVVQHGLVVDAHGRPSLPPRNPDGTFIRQRAAGGLPEGNYAGFGEAGLAEQPPGFFSMAYFQQLSLSVFEATITALMVGIAVEYFQSRRHRRRKR